MLPGNSCLFSAKDNAALKVPLLSNSIIGSQVFVQFNNTEWVGVFFSEMIYLAVSDLLSTVTVKGALRQSSHQRIDIINMSF